MKKVLSYALLLMSMCLFTACPSDDDEEENGSSHTGKRLWYVHCQYLYDREHEMIYEYVYDYFDDGEVKALTKGSGAIDDLYDSDGNLKGWGYHYNYSANEITVDNEYLNTFVCHLVSGRITRIDNGHATDGFYYEFEYDDLGRLITMKKLHINAPTYNYTIYLKWEGDELSAYQYSNYAGSIETEYSFEPSTTENKRCDAQYSPLMYCIENFVSSVDGVSMAVHPLEAYFGKRPAHLIGVKKDWKTYGKVPQVDYESHYTYNVGDGDYVQSVNEVSGRIVDGKLVPTSGGPRYLVWK